jgi:hypothetical protein
MNPTEGGGIGGNPDRQGKHGERGKAGNIAQHAPSVTKVAPEQPYGRSLGEV